MGFSFGGSGGSSTTTSSQNTSGTSTATKNYSADQQNLQSQLLQTLNGLITSPANNPQIQASQTASADQINGQYSSMGDRLNQYLAQRGFGQSGQAGQAALQTELGRQGALAQNSATYGQAGLNLMTTGLQDALAAAYNPASQTTVSDSSTTGKQNTSNYQLSGGVKF
jgi:hypothetical protein